MIFAIMSCLACAALVAYSARAVRHMPATARLERMSRTLGAEKHSARAHGDDDQRLRELVNTIETTNSRAVAVAALNEFIGDAEQESSRGASIPSSLGRVCLTLGLLLAVLAVTQALASPERGLTIDRFTPALVAATAGLMGGLLCYQIGQQANLRRREYRDQARRLARSLERLVEARLPQEAATKAKST
jgi:hypothetical protein